MTVQVAVPLHARALHASCTQDTVVAPVQWPSESHRSPYVQRFPSLQVDPAAALEIVHVDVPLQLLTLQGSGVVHVMLVPPQFACASQTSLYVQAFPSLHEDPAGRCTGSHARSAVLQTQVQHGGGGGGSVVH